MGGVLTKLRLKVAVDQLQQQTAVLLQTQNRTACIRHSPMYHKHHYTPRRPCKNELHRPIEAWMKIEWSMITGEVNLTYSQGSLLRLKEVGAEQEDAWESRMRAKDGAF